METVANSLACHANHVLSAAAIRKAHLSTAGPDPCNRCVRVCVSGCHSVHVHACGWFTEFICVRLSNPCISSDNTVFLLNFCEFIIFVQIGGRCAWTAERGIQYHIVIVCRNCLISLFSASNPLTPTKQSELLYELPRKHKKHTQIQTHWCRQT